MKRIFSLIAVVGLVLVGAGCHKENKVNVPSKSAAPSGPIELKLKWTPGEKIVENLDMKMDIDVDVPGQPMPINQQMTMGQKFSVTVLRQTATGGHELEMEFLAARVSMAGPGQPPVEYDSEKSSSTKSSNPMAKIFSKLIGEKIRYILDATNEVERIEGLPDLVKKLSEGSNPAMKATIKSMINESYFKEMMSSARYLPSKPVQPGDTWPVVIETTSGQLGDITMDYTMTFKGWEMHGVRNCVRLDFTGSIKGKPGETPNGMTMDLQDGQTSGVSWFDPDLGIIIDTQVSHDMKIVMTMNAMGKKQTMTTHLKQDLGIKLDSVQ